MIMKHRWIAGLFLIVVQCASLAAAQSISATPDPRRQVKVLERIAPEKRTDGQRLELARAYRRLGRLDKAFALASELTIRRPEAAEAWLIQGDIWREREQWQRALEVFDRVAKLQPTRADVALRQGQALMALGKTREGDQAFSRFKSLQQVQMTN